MGTQVGRTDEQFEVRRFNIHYPISEYTFPSDDHVQSVRFDDECVHVELADGRCLSVPLQWIPTLKDAPPEAREQYEINASRTAVVWDPDKCGINDELRIADYLNPRSQ